MSKKDISNKGSNLSQLLDTGYVFMGLDGTVLETNAALAEMLGYAEKDVVGQVFFNLWAVPNMGEALVNQVLSEKIVRGFVLDMKHENGETVVASINAQLVVNQEDFSKGIECIISEVDTKQKEFDETLRNVTGGIAHLINNQMVSVVGTADLMKTQLNDRPELKEKLDRISKSGLQASDVAHNLVDYADITGSNPLITVNLKEITSLVIQKYNKEVFIDEPRKITVRLAKGLPSFSGDTMLLIKLLSYLLDNAVEATKEGDAITISGKVETLEHKKTGLNQEYVMLSVEDNGHGMDAETQHRIFEPFFSTRFMGRGMSLAHVLKIIKVHHGRIHVKTGLNQGTIFKVYFPLERI